MLINVDSAEVAFLLFLLNFRVAFGNTIGVALLDYLQKKPLMILMNYELGGKSIFCSTEVDRAGGLIFKGPKIVVYFFNFEILVYC